MAAIPASLIATFIGMVLLGYSLNLFVTAVYRSQWAFSWMALTDLSNLLFLNGKGEQIRLSQFTTIAMVIGMLPIALASCAGAEWKNGLAWIIIGGLVSSLLLTLVIVPVIYSIFDKLINKVNSNKKSPPVEELLHADYIPLLPGENGINPSHV